MTETPSEELREAPARDARREAIDALGPWFHNLHLPDGTQTAPAHALGDFPRFKWLELAHALPDDLHGVTALDVGCNAGFYTFELARRGARVVGIDREPLYLRQARWAANELGLSDRVEFRELEVYDLAHTDERYDLVLFMGVFYHLRHPLLALDLLAEKVRGAMVFQTLTMPGTEVADVPRDIGLLERAIMQEPSFPKMAFIEHALASDATNWWAPNHAAVLAMLRSSGFSVVAQPGHEIYICEPDHGRPAAGSRAIQDELAAATGRHRARAPITSEPPAAAREVP